MGTDGILGTGQPLGILYTLEEAARICRLSVRTLKRRIDEGKLKRVQFGARSIRVTEAALREFIEGK